MKPTDEERIQAILTAIEAAEGVPIPLNIARKVSATYEGLKAWNDSVVREE
jgi:hypothetical protein